MGDIAKQDEARRFIDEFQTDILEKYNIQLGKEVQVKPKVELNHSWMTVHLYAELLYDPGPLDHRERWTVMLPDVFFSVASQDRDRVDAVMEQLELDEDEAIRRLKKAGLVETVTCKLCQKEILEDGAHHHDGGWVGECCWDERLKATE